MASKEKFCNTDIKRCSDFITTNEFTDFVTLSKICHEVCKDNRLAEKMFSKILNRSEFDRIYKQRKDSDKEYMETRNDILQRYMMKKNSWMNYKT